MSEDSVNSETIGKWLAILSSASLGVSIVFDYGFYSALNMSFSDVPTQLADHTRSVLIWLPALFSFAVFLIFINLILKAFFPNALKPDEKVGLAGKYRLLYLLALLAVQVLFILYGDRAASLGVFYSVFLYLEFSRYIFSRPNLKDYNNSTVKFIFVVVPVAIYSIHHWGYANAVSYFTSDNHYSNIVNIENKTEKLIVLRELEKGVLVSDDSRKISFIQWSEIKRIESIGMYVENVGLACKTFQINCASKNTTNP